MFRILFLCTGNSGRSQMAAAFARSMTMTDVEVFSASDCHHSISTTAIKMMDEIGSDLPEKIELSISEIESEQFDIVVTLCNQVVEICPPFPGSPARIHWPVTNPVRESTGKPDQTEDVFRAVRDDIQQRVNCLFHGGFIESIGRLRLTFSSLLDNLTDGVMAHDLDRRIYFFNKAAQKITGYDYSEVIGHDCHDVFPDRFCGGDCSFCDDKTMSHARTRYPQSFKRKNGEKCDLEMSVVTINPPDSDIIGALIIFRDVTEMVHLRKKLIQSRGFQGIVGHHVSMQRVFESIRELSEVNVPILIQGESGTGKEMVAVALHQISSRSSGPFVPVNCGALPEGTLESELFGHVKGAFTGAINDRKGRFELADGGTIFLDEIGEVSPAMQVKLLRVIQDMCFIPVGGENNIRVNVRVICATNNDLKLLTQQGLFREDLYYRLAVVPINMPALRERKSDIAQLVEHFLDKFSIDTDRRVLEVAPDAMNTLIRYNWPGNVRELGNAIQYGIIKCHNKILEVEHLPPEILKLEQSHERRLPGRPPIIDIVSVNKALQRTAGNKAKAARLLDISRTTLYRLIRKDKA